jgi:ribosome maturation factor RimP
MKDESRLRSMKQMTDLKDAAIMILEPLGFEVLELSISGQGQRGQSQKRRLLLRIDRLDEKVVSMEDVTLATRVFGLELDRLDPFETPYGLEVESPGPQRPLFTKRHFERFHDLQAKVKTKGETFKGIIRTVASDAENSGSENRDTITFQIGNDLKTYPIAEVQANLAEWPKEPR